jgi:hypothetical protein
MAMAAPGTNSSSGIMVWEKTFRESLASRFSGTQFGEESSIIEEVSPEELGYAKNEMTVRYGLEDFFTEPFPELHYPFLVRGGAEMATVTREGKKVFVSAALALHTGEAVMEDAAIQVAIDALPYAGTEEAVMLRKNFIVDLFLSFGKVGSAERCLISEQGHRYILNH